MKKLLLVISLVSATTATVNAQCTPDITDPAPNYQDSIFGAWPDTTTNFGPATQGVPYTQDLQFKIPLDAGLLDPILAGSTVESFTVTLVNGLPMGLTYACNIASCEFLGGTVGCALISGTTNVAAGNYPITIDVLGIITTAFGPAQLPHTFVGYDIVVGISGIVEAIINPISIYPNPANDKITLSGLNEQMKISSVVITNMEGKVIRNVKVMSSTMDVSLSGFESGVYFVVVNHAGGNETLKFIKD